MWLVWPSAAQLQRRRPFCWPVYPGSMVGEAESATCWSWGVDLNLEGRRGKVRDREREREREKQPAYQVPPQSLCILCVLAVRKLQSSYILLVPIHGTCRIRVSPAHAELDGGNAFLTALLPRPPRSSRVSIPAAGRGSKRTYLCPGSPWQARRPRPERERGGGAPEDSQHSTITAEYIPAPTCMSNSETVPAGRGTH
ncbi:hypothetical protein LX36DRAFT_347311 [Colletotrichum falcatum]|nr:hypothetical protein LX36DRAFT_347311 [Colletotrichum falcatum]